MVDRPSYPQIPTTVWWGLRQSLRKSPAATIDEGFLAVNLNVQPAAARQYVSELKRVGLLSEEGKATAVAMKWRNDETYREAANEIVQASYPSALLDVAPPGEAERTKVVNWFMHNGLGEGTAKNKAATYLMMANDPVQDAPDGRATAPARSTPPDKPVIIKSSRPNVEHARQRREGRVDSIPLNVNVQIHISADASSEQIQAIFSSMRRYLYDDQVA